MIWIHEGVQVLFGFGVMDFILFSGGVLSEYFYWSVTRD